MFAAAHYAALVVFVVSCWGWGRGVLARLAPPPRRDAWLEGAVAVALGVGLFICAFQVLAIFGAFKPGATLAVIGAGTTFVVGWMVSWFVPLRASEGVVS